jgi:hypothetical protein
MSKRSTKHLPTLFEKAASDTWGRLKASSELDISQNETTITDIILLDFKAAKCPFLHLMKTPQNLEPLQGTDWEWWIGANSVGWLRYAVQAKKIDLSSLRYDKLHHKIGEKKVDGKKVDGKLQLEILRSYSSENKALARYCFYNYANTIQQSQHWHCNLPFDSTQLGCSIATLSTVSKAIDTRGGSNFDFIHSEISTLPFRCLVTCPMILSVYAGATRFPAGFDDYKNAKIFESLPGNIQQGIETGSFEEWDSHFYSNEVRYRPERILVAELPYWSDRT